jgi:hypothetical protein
MGRKAKTPDEVLAARERKRAGRGAGARADAHHRRPQRFRPSQASQQTMQSTTWPTSRSAIVSPPGPGSSVITPR